MAPRIHRLDSLTIDKIAAGEVIEVPASCVKELVDNSLDAGASEVVIEIILGGRELIRIADNGCGMSREDVIASIERHSTSKINTVEDLERLMLRGFRGEALSSIVSISQVSITSAEGGMGLVPATSLIAEGGAVKAIIDTTGKPGTTVEVRSLFYNVPVRRKFLKSPHKDTQEIIKAVTLLALSAPSVGFRLMADGKQSIYCPAVPGNNIVPRIHALLGDPFQAGSFELHHDQEGFSIHGIIASPSQARSTRSAQYLIVNGRPVQSLPISYAVKSGYGTSIDQAKQPAFALHITLEANSIDINVHPQKREIRLADEDWVKVLVREAISKVLFGHHVSMPQMACSPSVLPFGNFEGPFFEHAAVEEPLLPLESSLQHSDPVFPLAVIGDVAMFKAPLHFCSPRNDQMLLLDLKQAMRAVCFIELERKTKEVATDFLLLPLQIDCSTAESAQICAHKSSLEAIGFLIRPIGPTGFIVEGIPSQLVDVDIRMLIFEILEEDGKPDAQRNKRLSSIYVSSMKCLRQPISHQTAQIVYKKWADHGYPKMTPDGSFCFSFFDGARLKEWVAKQGVSL